MKRFSKLLFVALMLTVLVVSKAKAETITCSTPVGVPILTGVDQFETLPTIVLNCSGGPTTANIGVLSNAQFTSLHIPELQVFNGSASTPAATVPGQLVEGYDNKAVIWLGVPVSQGDSHIHIVSPIVNAKVLYDVSPPNTAVAGKLYLSYAGSPSVHETKWIDFALPVPDTTICKSFVPNMPDNSLSLLLRNLHVGSSYYNALLTSLDGSNKFNLTAAAEVDPGKCTDAASVTTEQNGAKDAASVITEQNGAEIDINDTNYKGTDYKVKISYAAGDKSFAVTSATRIPKAGFSVNPSSFTITHSWSAPYSTSCPQLIGIFHIINTGEAGSKLRFVVGRSQHTLIYGGDSGIVLGGDALNLPLDFNCDVPGPGTYTDTVVIAGVDDNTNDIFPNQTITVTIVVTP